MMIIINWVSITKNDPVKSLLRTQSYCPYTHSVIIMVAFCRVTKEWKLLVFCINKSTIHKKTSKDSIKTQFDEWCCSAI